MLNRQPQQTEQQKQAQALLRDAHGKLQKVIDRKAGVTSLSSPEEYKLIVEARNAIYDLAATLNLTI